MTEHTEHPDYSELRERIHKLGYNQSSFARRMHELGDDRPVDNILRSIQRQVAGSARFSGEMRALLGLMEEVQRKRLPAPIDTKYDSEADVLRVTFGPKGARSDTSQEVAPGIYVKFDPDGNAIGVEITCADRRA